MPRLKSASETTDESLAAVWQRYLVGRNVADRNLLVELYQPMVGRIAGVISSKLPAQVGFDELVSAGNLGLMAAIERFDPGRHVKFRTYAQQPIRGAILDYLREIDIVPRLLRRRAMRGAQLAESLRQRHGREPTPEEIAAAAGDPPGHARRSQDRMPVTEAMALAAPAKSLSLVVHEASDTRGPVRLKDVVADPAPSPAEALAERDSFAAKLRGLLPRERLVIELYYGEELEMKKIGQALGLTESRVSQLNSETLRVLRSRLQEREVH